MTAVAGVRCRSCCGYWSWKKEDENYEVQSSRNLGENRDQPFSFTAGDPGNLWSGITCRRTDRKDTFTGVNERICSMFSCWSVIKLTHTVMYWDTVNDNYMLKINSYLQINWSTFYKCTVSGYVSIYFSNVSDLGKTNCDSVCYFNANIFTVWLIYN